MANPKYSKYGKKYTRKELEAITGGKIYGFVWRDYKRGKIGGGYADHVVDAIKKHEAKQEAAKKKIADRKKAATKKKEELSYFDYIKTRKEGETYSQAAKRLGKVDSSSKYGFKSTDGSSESSANKSILSFGDYKKLKVEGESYSQTAKRLGKGSFLPKNTPAKRSSKSSSSKTAKSGGPKLQYGEYIKLRKKGESYSQTANRLGRGSFIPKNTPAKRSSKSSSSKSEDTKTYTNPHPKGSKEHGSWERAKKLFGGKYANTQYGGDWKSPSSSSHTSSTTPRNTTKTRTAKGQKMTDSQRNAINKRTQSMIDQGYSRSEIKAYQDKEVRRLTGLSADDYISKWKKGNYGEVPKSTSERKKLADKLRERAPNKNYYSSYGRSYSDDEVIASYERKRKKGLGAYESKGGRVTQYYKDNYDQKTGKYHGRGEAKEKSSRVIKDPYRPVKYYSKEISKPSNRTSSADQWDQRMNELRKSQAAENEQRYQRSQRNSSNSPNGYQSQSSNSNSRYYNQRTDYSPQNRSYHISGNSFEDNKTNVYSTDRYGNVTRSGTADRRNLNNPYSPVTISNQRDQYGRETYKTQTYKRKSGTNYGTTKPNILQQSGIKRYKDRYGN